MAIEAPGVSDLFGRPESAEQWDRLIRPMAALVDGHLAGPELLRVLAADADPQDQAATGGTVEISDLLGDDRRRIERQEQDGRTDVDPLGRR